jgi:ABC-2 type transport system ATP-binding protein
MTNAIEVKNLAKHFGKFVAVDDVSFTVSTGEIFGFLGANGAGKSTTIRMLCGLLTSSSGTATVAGYDINKSPELVKQNIGYMSQKFSLYEDLTVKENISFFGGIYGLDDNRIKDRLGWVLKMAGLENKENMLTKDLSGGWKQRLALGCAILHDPKILFLDEPTGGVDPISRRNFWELINTLSESGTTVFVTTHYLDEAEYCNRIMLIQAGKIVAGGTPQELKTKYITNPLLEVECPKLIEAMDLLQNQDWVTETSVFGKYIHVNVADEQKGRTQIPVVLAQHGITVSRINRITPSLEDVFIHVIEQK